MSDDKEVKFSLKVMINKEKTKVLFAEVDCDFVDVLLNFLTLPLGKIVKILEKHYGDKAPVIGSLPTLFNGLTRPGIVDFWTKLANEVLSNPRSEYENRSCNLKVNVDYTVPTTYEFGKPYNGVFTADKASFLISDVLRVVPNVSGSIIQSLSNLGVTITEMEGAEIKDVTFGFEEIMDLLKCMLISRTPLADVIFDKRRMDCATVKSDPEILLHKIDTKATSHYSEKMILKVTLQKSTKKLLFAQAEDDFVEFLFSILIIPLGRVEWLLGSNTCLTNMDNLYRSAADLSYKMYMSYGSFSGPKEWLIKPDLPDIYKSTNLLPLNHAVYSGNTGQLLRKLIFVTGPKMYVVTDDLTVTPLGMTSTVTFLNKMKISLSDVEELEVHIGLEEALSILKASLTSATALTHGLINPMLKKKLKQEH